MINFPIKFPRFCRDKMLETLSIIINNKSILMDMREYLAIEQNKNFYIYYFLQQMSPVLSSSKFWTITVAMLKKDKRREEQDDEGTAWKLNYVTTGASWEWAWSCRGYRSFVSVSSSSSSSYIQNNIGWYVQKCSRIDFLIVFSTVYWIFPHLLVILCVSKRIKIHIDITLIVLGRCLWSIKYM